MCLGALMQYTIMPFMGYAVSRLWGLSPAYSVGYAPLSLQHEGVTHAFLNVHHQLSGLGMPALASFGSALCCFQRCGKVSSRSGLRLVR